MPVITLTDISLRNLKPIEGKQITYIDKSLKGFGVRITEKGHATYVLVFGANRQRIKIGNVGVIKLADARNAARTLLAEKQLGHLRPHKAPTYDTAVKDFLEDKNPELKARTHRDYTRLLNRHGFKNERLTDIAPHDIIKKLSKLAPSEKFHAHVALNIFFRWAFRRHLIEHNPMERMDSPPKGKPRERILTEEEIKRIWRSATGDYGDIVRLCLLTGQRRSEVASIEWNWIDGDLITLPASITKNKRVHTFPIGSVAATIIAARPRTTGYLFPARKQWRGTATIYNAWGKDHKPLLEASETTGWVLHDLRRTLRSSWSKLGVLREVSERYINHISGVQSGVEAIYDRHTYIPEMRLAIDRYENFLQSLTSQG